MKCSSKSGWMNLIIHDPDYKLLSISCANSLWSICGICGVKLHDDAWSVGCCIKCYSRDYMLVSAVETAKHCKYFYWNFYLRSWTCCRNSKTDSPTILLWEECLPKYLCNNEISKSKLGKINSYFYLFHHTEAVTITINSIQKMCTHIAWDV